MQDNTKFEKSQAEALSAAIDALNRGMAPDESQDDELTELLHAARLVKQASTVTAPPPAVLDHLVDQAATTIAREKRKRSLAWGFASVTSAVAAVVLVVLLQVMPPVTPEQQLARTMPPAAETEPPPAPSITQPPPDLITPPAETRTPALPAVPEPPAGQPEAAEVAPAADEPPQVALMPPQSPVPAASGTMLALAERKADLVTIDAVTKTIRQVYHQGSPAEIIITQGPKTQRSLRTAPRPPEMQMKMAAPVPNESVEIKPPGRNKVTVTIGNIEVTLEGAATEAELLSLAKTLTQVSIAN